MSIDRMSERPRAAAADEGTREERPPRLILLPGMGTRAPLLEPQRKAFPTLQTPDWLPARNEESLADYAARLVKTIDTTPPFYLGGVSFGGMVALEMATHCEPRGVFLLGSSRTGKRVPAHIRPFARLGRRLPNWMLKLVPRPLIRKHFVWREQLEPEHIELLKRATKGFDRDLFHWIGGAIANWHFDKDPGCPVYQIHGRKDWILRPPKPGRNVEFIDDGRHMISNTHPRAVNDFIHRHAPDLPYTPENLDETSLARSGGGGGERI